MSPREILDARFPDALGGLVAGSTARGGGTASSDVDLVVLLPGRPAPMRGTDRALGRLVEFFVHTEASLAEFCGREVPLRRSPLLHMTAQGRVVKDTDGRLGRLQEWARERWAAGPPPLTGDELDDRRYRLTGALDDLVDEKDPAHRAAIATGVFVDVADLALVGSRHWIGTGRWLTRRLRAADPVLCDELVASLRLAVTDDAAALVRCGQAVLHRFGGPLAEGYERGVRPGTQPG